MAAMLGIIGGAITAAAAASYLGYATMGPTSQLYGRSFTGAPGTKLLALTYDDGPNDPHTLHLLDVLAKHEVKATFFMIGRFVAQKPEIARRVREAGHAVGNHTYNHPLLIFTSSSQLQRELEDTDKAIADAIGGHDGLFRPPFGGRRPGTFAAVRKRRMTPVMWSVTCYDWSAQSAEAIEERAQGQIRGGDVILLHDGSHVKMGAFRGHTVEATDRLIRRYKGEGYEFVTIPQMITESSVVGRRPSARS
jgi:peptidoglycan/xylan/chitin deacetylase (PgdA/CDA1 family)